MLDKIRKMLGVKDLPEEVTPLYRGARNEREALVLLKEARRRDESRRRRAMADLEELDRAEEELLEEGKSESISESRKLMLARRIKEIRWKMQELNNRIENIYNKRLKVLNEHVASLETILELTSEALPDKKTMEDMAIKAKQLLEDLEKTKELAEGIALAPRRPARRRGEGDPPRDGAPRAGGARAREGRPKRRRRSAPSRRRKRRTEAPVREKEPPEIMFEE
jgi:hypothetical protein